MQHAKLILFILFLLWSATADGATISAILVWVDTSNNESGFAVERASTSGGPFSAVGKVGANVTTYTDSNLVSGVQYCYRAYAFNDKAQSGYSNVFCLTPALPRDHRSVVIRRLP